jgi:hypothetical protein
MVRLTALVNEIVGVGEQLVLSYFSISIFAKKKPLAFIEISMDWLADSLVFSRITLA